MSYGTNVQLIESAALPAAPGLPFENPPLPPVPAASIDDGIETVVEPTQTTAADGPPPPPPP